MFYCAIFQQFECFKNFYMIVHSYLSFYSLSCHLFAIAYSAYSQLPSISGGHILYPQPQDAPCCGDRDPPLIYIICVYVYLHIHIYEARCLLTCFSINFLGLFVRYCFPISLCFPLSLSFSKLASNTSLFCFILSLYFLTLSFELISNYKPNRISFVYA